MLGCYPVFSLNGLKVCKFVSPSDLVLISFSELLDADHSLDFLIVVFPTEVARSCFRLVRINNCRWMLTIPWIVYPISFCKRASRLVAFQTKVARSGFCLARIKMPLLMGVRMVLFPNLVMQAAQATEAIL